MSEIIITCTAISIIIYIFLKQLYKQFQKLCLFIVFKKFKNENTWYCRFTQKYAHIIFGIGIGSKWEKISK